MRQPIKDDQGRWHEQIPVEHVACIAGLKIVGLHHLAHVSDGCAPEEDGGDNDNGQLKFTLIPAAHDTDDAHAQAGQADFILEGAVFGPADILGDEIATENMHDPR